MHARKRTQHLQSDEPTHVDVCIRLKLVFANPFLSVRPPSTERPIRTPGWRTSSCYYASTHTHMHLGNLWTLRLSRNLSLCVRLSCSLRHEPPSRDTMDDYLSLQSHVCHSAFLDEITFTSTTVWFGEDKFPLYSIVLRSYLTLRSLRKLFSSYLTLLRYKVVITRSRSDWLFYSSDLTNPSIWSCRHTFENKQGCWSWRQCVFRCR